MGHCLIATGGKGKYRGKKKARQRVRSNVLQEEGGERKIEAQRRKKREQSTRKGKGVEKDGFLKENK